VRFLLSGMTGIDIHQLRSSANAETLARIRKAAETLENVPLHFSLCCGMPLDEIDVPIWSVAEYDRKGEKNPIKLLVVDSLDYLGLDLAVFEPHEVPDKTEEREIVMQRLTKIASEHSLAILALARLGRGVERRAGRPIMRDISYCQYVEPYSDTILLLMQESYYSDSPMATEPAQLIVAKNRFGPTGTVRLGWDRLHMQFLDVQTESPKTYGGKEKER
jgi:replicative DNA helicase